MQLIHVVAAVVDTRQLTLYKIDGSTVAIPQGDPRLRRIVEEIAPYLGAGLRGWAVVDIDQESNNPFREFEEQSTGIRFFRVAKEKLKKLFGMETKPEEPVADVTLGSVPVVPSPTATVASATPPNVASAPALSKNADVETFDKVDSSEPIKANKQTMSVVDEIISNAIPVSSEQFTTMGLHEQRPVEVNGVTGNDHPKSNAKDTIVVMVDNKIIPNMELIKSQFDRAAKLGSTAGIEKFLKRLSTVIEHRSHSVEDLLNFMERADLPISDDGSIIIYKILRRAHGKQKVYVDCHTGKVEQWVGAYVCMDASLVDHNRRNECSNGLHVARRGYLKNFSGDVCVLAKLAPEDVIAVPTYDANKMRVCGYHILLELPENLFDLLKNNKPITETVEGRELLAKAMSGNHIEKTDIVRINGNRGADVVVTKVPKGSQPAPELTVVKVEEAVALSNEAQEIDKALDPKALETEVTGGLTRKEQAQQLYEAWANATGDEKEATLTKLVDFKKQSKVGWDRLGIPNPLPQKDKDVQDFEKKKQAIAKSEAKAAETIAAVQQSLPKDTEGSPRERIAKLVAIGIAAPAVSQKIYDIKKASKKSWENLGVDDATVQQVLKNIGKAP